MSLKTFGLDIGTTSIKAVSLKKDAGKLSVDAVAVSPFTAKNILSESQVNQQMIAPPVWKRAGQKGNAEIPLSDEGYEYRAPTMIPLQKGWNKVRIKIPIDQLKGKDWQNPAKYMFTFVPVAQ